jgi:CheY-like chemotaxis protein
MASILIVEDTGLTLQLLYYVLQRNNHTVYKAMNGLEALDNLEENSVDLIITDIHMPEMDGLHLLDEIRSNENLREIPVIVLTASGLESIERLAFEKGATAFLTQPFSSMQLERLVSDCIGVI